MRFLSSHAVATATEKDNADDDVTIDYESITRNSVISRKFSQVYSGKSNSKNLLLNGAISLSTLSSGILTIYMMAQGTLFHSSTMQQENEMESSNGIHY
jgi:hypothetical protein